MKTVKGITKSARMLGFFKSAYGNNSHGSKVVAPIGKVETGVPHDHHAGLEQLESVYDKLREMTEEYRSFFRNEQELENAFSHVEDGDTTFIDNLMTFLDIYNSTLETLMTFDTHFGTTHHDSIKLIVDNYKDALDQVSITVEPVGYLRYVRTRLLKAYAHDASDFNFLILNPGMTKLLLRKFRAVKAVILDESDDKLLADDIHGVVIDRKC